MFIKKESITDFLRTWAIEEEVGRQFSTRSGSSAFLPGEFWLKNEFNERIKANEGDTEPELHFEVIDNLQTTGIRVKYVVTYDVKKYDDHSLVATRTGITTIGESTT